MDAKANADTHGRSGSLFGTNEDDVLLYDPEYKQIHGAPGVDTLVVPAGTTLNLSDHNIFSIENFTLGGGNSTIVLNADEIMRLTSAPHTVQITGLAGDAVYAGEGWSYVGISGSSAMYRSEDATLIVDTDVRRSGIVDHSPDAHGDTSLTVMEDSEATPLAIGAPAELDGDPLIVTVLDVPNSAIGSVFLGAGDGGTAVFKGQELGVDQLQRLVFTPVRDANGTAGAFSYSVADQGTLLGLSDTQTVTIDVLPVPDGGPRVIDFVPAYNWYHGCGPTAVASIFGYWDVQGYADYFDASGWDQVRYTFNVRDEISSPAHNAKYDPTPDNPLLPVPPMTSIADFLHTSQDPLGYGWTYLSYIEPGMEAYANLRGQPLDAWTVSVNSWAMERTWQTLMSEIDAGRPSVFLVDTSGDGVTDHFVPVLGYDDRGDQGLWYGAYTTWSESETLSWFQFRPMGYGKSWGVGFITFVDEPDGLAVRVSTIAEADAVACGLDSAVELIGAEAQFTIEACLNIM